MIIKGSVKPLTMPYLNVKSYRTDHSTDDGTSASTPILKRRYNKVLINIYLHAVENIFYQSRFENFILYFQLGIGDFFGTHEMIENNSASSK